MPFIELVLLLLYLQAEDKPTPYTVPIRNPSTRYFALMGILDGWLMLPPSKLYSTLTLSENYCCGMYVE